MSNMVCTYCKDEFCVNDKCPMRGDYCPVPDMPGVCRYEERVMPKLTPKDCMIQALREYDVIRVDTVLDDIYETFRVLLAENNLEITEHKFIVGNLVHIGAIIASKDWKLAGEINGDTAHYEYVDGTMSATFVKNEDWTTIMRLK